MEKDNLNKTESLKEFTVDIVLDYIKLLIYYQLFNNEEKLTLLKYINIMLKKLRELDYFKLCKEFGEREENLIRNLIIPIINLINETEIENLTIEIKEKQDEIIKVLTLEMIKNLENDNFIEIWKEILKMLNHHKIVRFMNKNKEFNHIEFYTKYYYSILNNDIEWSRNLKVGDKVDFLYFGQLYIKNYELAFQEKAIGNWILTEVLEVFKNGKLKLRHLGIGDVIHNIVIPSPFLLPAGTLSTDQEWRENLQIDDEIEYLFTDLWYKAKVTNVGYKMVGKIKCKYVELLLIENDSGFIQNTIGIEINKRFHNCITVHDLRIRKPKFINSNIKLQLKNKNLENFIPFSINFIIVNSLNHFEYLNMEYFNFLQFFINQKGFEKIINYFSNHSNNYKCQLNQSYFLEYFTLMGELQNFFYCDYYLNYIGNFIENYFQFLKRYFTNNITEQIYVDEVFSCLDDFTKFYPESLRNLIKDKITNLKSNLNDNALQNIFNINSDLKIIVNSLPTVLDYVENKKFVKSHLDLIYCFLKQTEDYSIKYSVFKILRELSIIFDSDFLIYFFENNFE